MSFIGKEEGTQGQEVTGWTEIRHLFDWLTSGIVDDTSRNNQNSRDNRSEHGHNHHWPEVLWRFQKVEWK